MPKPRYSKRNVLNSRFKGKSIVPQINKEYQHKNQLQEIDVGITQFISNLEGFSGVIKARFSDFQVNEIDLNDEVAKLTDQRIPSDFRSKEQTEAEVPLETPLSQIPQSVWDELRIMLEKSEGTAVTLDATNVLKTERTQIHDTLRRIFGRKVVANTESTGEKKIMVFKKFDGKDDHRLNWPKDKGEFVHFLVYKECLDTLEATLKIASCLKISASNLAYAGVKDKRAKSTQWFSAKKVEPWKLIIKTKSLRNIRIGNITFKDKPLKLGDLKGNKFRIALRNVTGSNDLIIEAVHSLKDQGFINYYGLQRFGNDKEVPTFSIGIQLLLGNWKEACHIILKPTESDKPEFDVTKAKKVFMETGDAGKALGLFEETRRPCIEYLLLLGLSKGHSNDFVSALSSIPRNMRLLYIHSFQSLVWNMVASKRIEEFGLEVVEGDLVFAEKTNFEESGEGANFEPARMNVKPIVSTDCSRYTIYDVVLPLPGYDITYPKHLETFYKETLEKFGLTLEMTQQKVREYSLSGTYRRLLGKVQNLSWKIMHYDDPNCNLIRSDLEELKGMEEPKDVIGGAYKALVLEFSLDSSSYATMVLREILKIDTSSSAHANLNNYHVETPETKSFHTSQNDKDTEDSTEKIGLLCDTEKYEAFKNLVFGEQETTTLKRKHDNENIASQNAKLTKFGDTVSK